MDSSLQVTFDFVGKRQQRKRHDKARHRQPESAASGIMASLQVSHYHGRSTPIPGLSQSNKTTSVIAYVHDNEIGSNWIFIGGSALSLVNDKRSMWGTVR